MKLSYRRGATEHERNGKKNLQPARRAVEIHRQTGEIRRLRVGQRSRPCRPACIAGARCRCRALAAGGRRTGLRRHEGRPEARDSCRKGLRDDPRAPRPAGQGSEKMKRRGVFAPEAQDDLLSLYTYIQNHSGPSTSIGYITRIERYCLAFDLAGERGTIYARDFVSSASSAGARSPSTSNRAPSSCRVSG